MIAPDGYHRLAGLSLVHHAGFRYWPLALLGPLPCSSHRTARRRCWVLSWRFEPDDQPRHQHRDHLLLRLLRRDRLARVHAAELATCYPRTAPALVGFLHGVWHLPLMLLTTAYNPAGNRLIVVPLFLAVLTVAGLYGYLRNASGSLWPVVIAHGTFNAVLGTLAGAAVIDNADTAAYVTGETGVFTLISLS